MSDEIVIAILAKDKAHILPYYLQCIINQTYPKNKLHLYIRTNDNNDTTESVLQEFIHTYGSEYASVTFNASSIDESIKQYSQHDWNCKRLQILGKIRQESIEYANRLGANYFVADCDNFITADTLLKLYSIKNLGVIAPMLRSASNYSNYHYAVTETGYYAENPSYYTILYSTVQGIFKVAVVHCTYFIAADVLQHVCYDDGSGRYEYVIFSDTLRKKNIQQYIDNRQDYGTLTFAVTHDEFLQETLHSVKK
jgi:hypothetical protein